MVDMSQDARFSALMKAAQQGDGRQYASLLQEITPILRRVVQSKRSFLPKEDIEDIVQDALLSLHSVRATYDPRQPFLPWVLAITRHRMADSARKQIRRRTHEQATENLPETSGNTDANSIEDILANQEEIGAALEHLPPGQRKAVKLLKLKELSLKEASQQSGMSIPALKVATHRAMKTLRIVLKRDSS